MIATKNLNELCCEIKNLVKLYKFDECYKLISDSMCQFPHSAVPHNLMGIWFEKQNKHIEAMKHFRAAYGLDPTYLPARFNMEHYGDLFGDYFECAYLDKDCVISNIEYDNNGVGRVRGEKNEYIKKEKQ